MLTVQDLLFKLQQYWQQQGCVILAPYDLPVGAATSHPATFFRAIGPEPWSCAYLQACRRPADSRYGNSPNRLGYYYQFQVIIKPSPLDIQDLYLSSLVYCGLNIDKYDIRFVEDDWENPTLGAWGVGWEFWLNSMEISQFTYFQQVGGLPCSPITGEITYGVERLAMYLQSCSDILSLKWSTQDHNTITYRDLFLENELEYSKLIFEHNNQKWLFKQFYAYKEQVAYLLSIELAIPAYDMLLQLIYYFNLLDAKSIFSVSQRADYILQIRSFAKSTASLYYNARERLGFPLSTKEYS